MRLYKLAPEKLSVHTRLTADDDCYYLFEYVSHKGPAFSRTNALIADLKIKPCDAAKDSENRKGQAIDRCAAALRSALEPSWVRGTTFVPIPSSKTPDHPDYDDRMERICAGLGPAADVRPLLRQGYSLPAAHEAAKGERPSVDVLFRVLAVDEALLAPPIRHIVLVDDVLTSGTHYRAAHQRLRVQFPDTPISGLFIARRKFAPRFFRR